MRCSWLATEARGVKGGPPCSSIWSRGRPFNSGWSHRGAQRASFSVGQPEAPDELTTVNGAFDHMEWDRVKPELRSPKQRESLGVIDGAPGEIDEPTTWGTLDVRTLEI